MRVPFQDNGRFGCISDAGICWAPLPLRPTVGSQLVREHEYAYVAVCRAGGQRSSMIFPWVDARLMSIFLAQTAAQSPNEHCIMFLDGAGWHKAHELTVPANMRLLPLPPNSPELNPAKQVWEYIRENDMRNQIFNALDEVMDTVETSLRDLYQAPEEHCSMTAFPWIIDQAA